MAMRIQEWRTRRVVALVLGYWTALLVLVGVSCYRNGTAAMKAYQSMHPGQGDFLVTFDPGWNPWFVAAFLVVPPIGLVGYRAWARRPKGTRPAV